MQKLILFIHILLSLITTQVLGQTSDDNECFDTISIGNLTRQQFRLNEIVFTKSKYVVPGKPYECISFDSTRITFTKSDGSSYSGTYYLYRNIIYFEINLQEKGSFAINCFDGKRLSVGVYYFDNKKAKLVTAHRTYIFNTCEDCSDQSNPE